VTFRVALTLEDNLLQRELKDYERRLFFTRVKKCQNETFHKKSAIQAPHETKTILSTFVSLKTGAPRGFSLSSSSVASKMRQRSEEEDCEEEESGEKTSPFDKEMMMNASDLV
jgi:hypothetical protein